MVYYAVRAGKIPGIYTVWDEAKQQVSGFKGAVYKKFAVYEDAVRYYEDCQEKKASDGRIQLYTDGSFKKGRAGWGVVAVKEDGTFVGYHGPVPLEKHTNNTGELYAIIVALENSQGKIEIFSDSQYSIRSVTEWIHGWRLNGWKTSKGQPVKNQELIMKIDQLLQGRDVKFAHVKAHNGNVFNEEADRLANLGADEAFEQKP